MATLYRAATKVTQSGADTQTEGSISTSLDITRSEGWRIRQVDFALNNAVLDTTALADQFIQLALSTKSISAGTVEWELDDSELLAMTGQIRNATTSGIIAYNTVQSVILPEGVVAVTDDLFFTISSSATGIAISATVRIWYDIVKLGQADFLRLLQSQG